MRRPQGSRARTAGSRARGLSLKPRCPALPSAPASVVLWPGPSEAPYIGWMGTCILTVERPYNNEIKTSLRSLASVGYSGMLGSL